jgi:hypothetical protein
VSGGDDRCTLCGRRKATTTWGAPVCQPCSDGLDSIHEELVEMERNDPVLAALGRDVEEACRSMWPYLAPLRPMGFLEVRARIDAMRHDLKRQGVHVGLSISNNAPALCVTCRKLWPCPTAKGSR